MAELVRKINVSLTEHEIEIVQDHSALTGINNFSAALRMIIREWVRSQTPSVPAKDNGHEEAN